jgi:choline dehydrogenase-like flavoprotein
MEFDYVIVGGGSAGCVLASRLSEDPKNRVALLEAGSDANTIAVKIPFLTVLTLPYRYKNWYYFTTPQPGLNGRRGYQPRGKILGGSSAINAMIYIRGQREDYDSWAKELGPEWSYDSVLPVFKSFEHNQNIDDDYHGQGGLLNVSNLNSPREVSRAFIDAAVACGHPLNRDFNGISQHGVGLYQVTQKNGRRHSAADAFVEPIRQRENLTVLCKARALSLIMDGKVCQGVKVRHNKSDIEIKAKKEVILSAGAFGSPQLLMLSGIGCPQELKKHAIKINHELPGVGQNFHDHIDVVLAYTSTHKSTVSLSPQGLYEIAKEYKSYKKTNKGLMTTNFAEAGGFLKTNPSDDRPDIQLHFVVGIVDKHSRRPHFRHGFSCHVCVLRPQSRGDIRLRSSSPYHAPLINPAFLEDDYDMSVLLKGFKMTREILAHKNLAPFAEKELFTKKTDDDSLIKLIRSRADTVYHPVGSCRMGMDEMAVVDPQLRVKGIEKLRVVDASVMPEVISGNTNAPTMMIASRAAELIMQN